MKNKTRKVKRSSRTKQKKLTFITQVFIKVNKKIATLGLDYKAKKRKSTPNQSRKLLKRKRKKLLDFLTPKNFRKSLSLA